MKKIHLNHLTSYTEEEIEAYLKLLFKRYISTTDKTLLAEIVKRYKYIEHYLETKELPRRVRYCRFKEEEEE